MKRTLKLSLKDSLKDKGSNKNGGKPPRHKNKKKTKTVSEEDKQRIKRVLFDPKEKHAHVWVKGTIDIYNILNKNYRKVTLNKPWTGTYCKLCHFRKVKYDAITIKDSYFSENKKIEDIYKLLNHEVHQKRLKAPNIGKYSLNLKIWEIEFEQLPLYKTGRVDDIKVVVVQKKKIQRKLLCLIVDIRNLSEGRWIQYRYIKITNEFPIWYPDYLFRRHNEIKKELISRYEYYQTFYEDELVEDLTLRTQDLTLRTQGVTSFNGKSGKNKKQRYETEESLISFKLKDTVVTKKFSEMTCYERYLASGDLNRGIFLPKDTIDSDFIKIKY